MRRSHLITLFGGGYRREHPSRLLSTLFLLYEPLEAARPMKNKAVVLLALSSCLGISSAVGVTEVCTNQTPAQLWANRVQAIQKWNKAHPEVVKRRHLDRDMHVQTSRLKEQIYSRYVRSCANVHLLLDNPYGFSEVQDTPLTLDDGGDSWDYQGPMDTLDLSDDHAKQFIEEQEHPLYTQPEMPLPDDPLTAYLPGFVPGYLGGGVLPYRPIAPAPVPEPLPFGFVAFGTAFLLVRGHR